MSPTDPIAVFGATGAQGRPVADLLLAAGRPVRAIARTPEKLDALRVAGAEPHAVDLADEAALERALDGVAGAFVHLPFVPVEALMRTWATAISRALLARGVPLAVFTTSGPVPDAPCGVVTLDSRLAGHEVLRASGAPIVFLEPVLYLGNLSEPFSALSVVRAGELRYPPFPSDVATRIVSVEDQAAAAVAALGRPDLAGRRLPVGRRLTGRQLAEGLSDGLGRDVRHVATTPQDLGAAVRPLMGDQVAQLLEDDYALIAARPAGLGLDADPDASHRELGVPVTPVADWARTRDWTAAAAVAGVA
jgi:uncharacterized protein YbjT (DUF2867 family)